MKYNAETTITIEEILSMAQHAYYSKDYEYQRFHQNKCLSILKKQNNIAILSFKGLTSVVDLNSSLKVRKKILKNHNFKIRTNALPKQHLIKHLLECNYIDLNYIVLTGHSLGGRYAQIAEQYFCYLKDDKIPESYKIINIQKYLKRIYSKLHKKDIESLSQKFFIIIQRIINCYCISFNTAPLHQNEKKYLHTNYIDIYHENDYVRKKYEALDCVPINHIIIKIPNHKKMQNRASKIRSFLNSIDAHKLNYVEKSMAKEKLLQKKINLNESNLTFI
mgnify:FL=1|tara:strand:+ start:3630 stop:4460 length:831 start_codon:yes stop_codon:yes gene_type:complete